MEPTKATWRSPEWVEVYREFLRATIAYADHPETPDSVAAPLLGALKRLQEWLDEEDSICKGDWIPEDLDV